MGRLKLILWFSGNFFRKKVGAATFLFLNFIWVETDAAGFLFLQTNKMTDAPIGPMVKVLPKNLARIIFILFALPKVMRQVFYFILP